MCCAVLCCAVVIRSIARCTLPFSRSLRTMKNSPNLSMFVTRSMFTCFTLLYITKLLQCDTATDTEWVTHGVDLGFVNSTQVFHVKKCWGAYRWMQYYQTFYVKWYWECYWYSIDGIITIIATTTTITITSQYSTQPITTTNNDNNDNNFMHCRLTRSGILFTSKDRYLGMLVITNYRVFYVQSVDVMYHHKDEENTHLDMTSVSLLDKIWCDIMYELE